MRLIYTVVGFNLREMCTNVLVLQSCNRTRKSASTTNMYYKLTFRNTTEEPDMQLKILLHVTETGCLFY